MKKQNLTINQFSGYFLLFCLSFLLYFLYRVLEPFIIDLILALIITSVFFPLYRRILNFTGKRRKLSSFITCLFIVFVILIPAVFFIYQFILEAIQAIESIYRQVQMGTFDSLFDFKSYSLYSTLQEKLLPVIDLETVQISDLNLGERFTESLTATATTLGKQVTNFATGIAFILFHFFIMIVSMFFFFKDSKKIIETLTHLSPLPTAHNKYIIEKFKGISQATLFGIFLTAMIQGVLGGIGFAITGISNPVFWGTLMALMALIPFLGTVIIWLPAAIYFLLIGNYVSGIFLFIWGGGVVSTIDNFLRPYLIDGRARTYPLLTFLSILGGLSAWGLVGVVLGPLILTLCFVFIEIYQTEYHGVLRHKDKPDKPKDPLFKKVIKKLKRK